MPAKSEKQARFMRAIEHGWKPTQKPYRGKELPSKEVAHEFSHMARGGFARTVGRAPMSRLQGAYAAALGGRRFAHGGESCPNCGYALGGEVPEEQYEAPMYEEENDGEDEYDREWDRTES